MFKIFIMLFSLSLYASPIFTDHLHENNLLLKGYDPVGYHLSKKAIKGNKKFQTSFKKYKVYFSSSKNRDLFITNPNQFLPQYNGWCAYAMAENGEIVDSNPKAFKIVNNKLYLFYKNFFIDTLKRWNKNKDESSYIKKADINWKKQK